MEKLLKDIKNALPSSLDNKKSVHKVEQSLQNSLRALQEQKTDDKCVSLLKSGIMFLIKVITLVSRSSFLDTKNGILTAVLDCLVIAAEHGYKASNFVATNFIGQLTDITLQKNVSFLAKIEVLNKLNIILESTEVAVKEKLVQKDEFKARVKDAFQMVLDAGDYELQVCLVEFLFRLFPRKLRHKLSKDFITNQTILQAFLATRDGSFEVDCRKFLNSINQLPTKARKVYSFPCQGIILGTLELQKPSDPGYDNFWIDINIYSRRILVFCENAQLSSQASAGDDCWDTLSVWKDDIEKFICEESGSQLHTNIYINAKAPCLQRLQNMASHYILHVITDKGIAMETALTEAFGKIKCMEVSQSMSGISGICLKGHLRDGNFFDNGDPSYSMADFPVDNSSVCAKNTVNVLSSNFIYQKPVLMQVSPVTAITEDFSPSAPNKTGNLGMKTPDVGKGMISRKRVKTPVVTVCSALPKSNKNTAFISSENAVDKSTNSCRHPLTCASEHVENLHVDSQTSFVPDSCPPVLLNETRCTSKQQLIQNVDAESCDEATSMHHAVSSGAKKVENMLNHENFPLKGLSETTRRVLRSSKMIASVKKVATEQNGDLVSMDMPPSSIDEFKTVGNGKKSSKSTAQYSSSRVKGKNLRSQALNRHSKAFYDISKNSATHKSVIQKTPNTTVESSTNKRFVDKIMSSEAFPKTTKIEDLSIYHQATWTTGDNGKKAKVGTNKINKVQVQNTIACDNIFNGSNVSSTELAISDLKVSIGDLSDKVVSADCKIPKSCNSSPNNIGTFVDTHILKKFVSTSNSFDSAVFNQMYVSPDINFRSNDKNTNDKNSTIHYGCGIVNAVAPPSKDRSRSITLCVPENNMLTKQSYVTNEPSDQSSQHAATSCQTRGNEDRAEQHFDNKARHLLSVCYSTNGYESNRFESDEVEISHSKCVEASPDSTGVEMHDISFPHDKYHRLLSENVIENDSQEKHTFQGKCGESRCFSLPEDKGSYLINKLRKRKNNQKCEEQSKNNMYIRKRIALSRQNISHSPNGIRFSSSMQLRSRLQKSYNESDEESSLLPSEEITLRHTPKSCSSIVSKNGGKMSFMMNNIDSKRFDTNISGHSVKHHSLDNSFAHLPITSRIDIVNKNKSLSHVNTDSTRSIYPLTCKGKKPLLKKDFIFDWEDKQSDRKDMMTVLSCKKNTVAKKGRDGSQSTENISPITFFSPDQTPARSNCSTDKTPRFMLFYSQKSSKANKSKKHASNVSLGHNTRTLRNKKNNFTRKPLAMMKSQEQHDRLSSEKEFFDADDDAPISEMSKDKKSEISWIVRHKSPHKERLSRKTYKRKYEKGQPGAKSGSESISSQESPYKATLCERRMSRNSHSTNQNLHTGCIYGAGDFSDNPVRSTDRQKTLNITSELSDDSQLSATNGKCPNTSTELSPFPSHNPLNSSYGRAAPVKGKISSMISRNVRSNREHDEGNVERLLKNMSRSQLRGLVSGPSTIIRPGKSELKRTFGDDSDSNSNVDKSYFDTKKKSLQPRRLFKDAVGTTKDTGPRQRRSSRSKKSMPSKGIQNIFNNVKSETVEKVISQLFFNDESSSPKACPSPNIEDLLSQPDGNVNTNESVTKVVSLLEGFGIDLQKQIKERQQQVQDLARRALKVTSKRFNQLWITDRTERGQTLGLFKDQFDMELGGLDDDFSEMIQAQKKMEAFYSQHLKMLTSQREKIENRVKALKEHYVEYAMKADEIEDRNLESQKQLEVQMKTDMERLRSRMLMEMQQQQLRRVKESFTKHFF